jgi:glycosyltransferase involved in cell wall biosynthesis
VRIALALGWYFPESIGGTEVYVQAIARSFQELGHEVVVAAPLAGLEAPVETRHEGVSVFRYGVPRQPTRQETRGVQTARGAEAFHAWLERFRPDILHVHSLVTGLGLAEIAAGRSAGARVIFTNHLPSLGFVCARGTLLRMGRWPCDGLREVRKCTACLLEQRGVGSSAASLGAGLIPQSLARAAWKWQGRPATALSLPALIEWNGRRQFQLMKLVDRFVALSDEAARLVRANTDEGVDRVVVNRLGISMSGYPRKPGPETRRTSPPVTIGYVGRFDWVKGLRELAEAIVKVPARAALRFEFRGPVNTPEERAVESFLRERLGSDERVHFMPAVKSSDVPRVLAGLDVLCVPSIWFENGPTIALESLAVGTPVIGTRFGAFPEAVADGREGALVPPGDVGALTKLFQQLALTPTMVDTWRSGIRPVRTMATCADDYLAMYRAVLASPEAAPAR